MAGSVALALAIGLSGMVFAAVAAVAAQFTANARSANAIAATVLGASFLLRALGDTGPTWVSWISPMGWAMRTRPYAGEVWWVPLLSVGLIAGLLLVAYPLVARRDVGAGLLRTGPPPPPARRRCAARSRSRGGCTAAC
jgi:ABC-2 type transport system permease protein